MRDTYGLIALQRIFKKQEHRWLPDVCFPPGGIFVSMIQFKSCGDVIRYVETIYVWNSHLDL